MKTENSLGSDSQTRVSVQNQRPT